MKQLLALMFLITFFAHAAAPEPGSQYLKAAEGGDRRAQYYLADSWFSSGDLGKAEYWAQKAADNGDADACALLAQIKITNPVSLDYPGAKRLAEKAAKAGSKAGGNYAGAGSGQRSGRTPGLSESHLAAAKRL
ncbi:putative exported protein [Salmonella enterica subsp. arizonae]|uniref:Putative exported protein n=1 Tax=Salmonella enterica subsp. arizonae TaxID=59203 RepID=A0A379SB10_SALER|nr:putative exported protein [Salmonella enterica subsp. arizonae]